MEKAIADLVTRLEAVTARLETVEGKCGGGAAPAAGTGESGAAFVAEYDALIAEHIVPLVAQTEKIGNDNVKKQVSLLKQAVDAQRNFLNVVAQAKKPSPEVLAKLLEPTSKIVGEIISLRDSNRPDKQFNWLSAISEGIPAFGWVSVEPTPGPFVGEYKGNAQFYTNKILMEFKSKDQEQVKWVNHWVGYFVGLVAYIKKFHTTGAAWKASGEDAAKFIGAAAPPAAAAAAAPKKAAAPVKKAAGGGGRSGLFAALNKGTGISSGMKKVTDDMKTKNRAADDRSSVVKAAPKKATAVRRFGQKASTQPPKFELDGNKWVVDYQVDNKDIVIEDPEIKHTVYIYKCINSVIQVKGKVNAITLDGCKKTQVVFTDCVSCVDSINCESITLQVTGKVPTVAFDKVAGAHLYLNEESLKEPATEILTSNISEMNVSIPGGENGDPIELAVPEQYKVSIVDKKVKVEPVKHLD
eukprot:TRINITY_DN16822_c0_g1_i1.p1 TRINITY_DN16822_c0_g1~~TRINITY_DN16822_c0_g1_i1.p1  ORF type:complete len:484 (-),score=186.14 TRINITY_DN16822_c0_g1_i1:100-1506(-)